MSVVRVYASTRNSICICIHANGSIRDHSVTFEHLIGLESVAVQPTNQSSNSLDCTSNEKEIKAEEWHCAMTTSHTTIMALSGII